ncbi:Imm32 family immunity protein [Streptomyces phaeochromogenes]
MRLVSDTDTDTDSGYDEVVLSASADELTSLASAVARGEGLLGSTSAPGGNALTGVEIKDASGPGVLIHRDVARQILVISGDSANRAVLAENLRALADAEDGGHLHIDYFPGHFYLAEGSLPLVVNSPHGGMPGR